MEQKYVMRIVEGALQDPLLLASLSPKVTETFPDDPEWKGLLEVSVTLREIKEIQKNMTRHYHDSTPWYMDGHEARDKNKVICAFGADDGENGKIFLFNRNDTAAFQEVLTYGISKGIPAEQLDFLEK